MKEAASKKVDAVNMAKPEEKEKVSATLSVQQSMICEAMTKKDTVMVVLYSVLLFLAMTVQTATMSMVLTVLAIASLIGKKPLENLRVHFSLPVIGLVAFAWMCGAASLYSRFGATAAAELYKLMASFSMAVILLARFEKKHVRGLLWGFATVCSMIALVCLDAGSWGKLFELFYALMERLGASYAHVLEQWGARANGIYNDANLTGALLGLAMLVSIYLAHTAENLWGRFVALTLLEISIVSFLAAMSRGAIVVFGVAVLVYLAFEGSKTRTDLFFLMLSAGVIGACAGALALARMEDGSVLPVLLAVIGGSLAFAGDWLIGVRLARKLHGHARVLWVLCSTIVVALGCAVFMALQMTEPYELVENGLLVRGMSLQPGEYTVSGDWNSDAAIRLDVHCRTEEDILVGRWPESYRGTIDEATFTVPEDTVWVSFYFRSEAAATLTEVMLSDGTSIPLRYTLLPESIASRFQDGLLRGQNFQLRLQYMCDGVNLFKQSPLLGHGLGSTEHLLATVQPFYYESLYIHNCLIQVLDEMGIAGFVVFLLLLFGSLFVLIQGRRKVPDSLTAALIACWVMMNLHSLMEINFSIRMYQCAAFFLLLLPVLYYDVGLLRQKWETACTYAVTMVIGLHLAVFGYLLYSHRAVDRDAAEFETTSAALFMEAAQDFAERAPFDKIQHQLNFVANAVMINDVRYNDTMCEYVDDLYETGTYATYMGLARYYWLPQGDFDEVFACSRLAVKQVAAADDAWNQQVEFYRNEVLPAMKPADVQELVEGVEALEEQLWRYSEGRFEEITFKRENETFVQTIKELKTSGLSDEEIYQTLVLLNAELTKAEN